MQWSVNLNDKMRIGKEKVNFFVQWTVELNFAIFMGFPLLLRCSLWYNRNIKRKQKITY